MASVYEQLDPAFAAKCSDLTLYSNTKGFFGDFVEEILSLARNDNWMEAFELADNSEKFVTLKKNAEVMDAIQEILSRIRPLYKEKDAKISRERRLAAERAFAEDEAKKAFELVCQAVLKAPMTGEDESVDNGISLALSLWLRSEILLYLQRPKASLADLKLAFKERLPVKMRAQYYHRLGHCYRDIGEKTKAKVSYELAARLVGDNEEHKNQIISDIQNLNCDLQINNKKDKAAIELSGGSKANMPSLSKLLEIAEDGSKGRFAVANSNIKTGDVLLIDNAYAACLLPDFFGTHCLNCFKRLEDNEDEAPLWCKICCSVAFCSLECQNTALSTYHRYECQFLDLLIGSGMSILSHLALRMVTQAGLDKCMDLHLKYVKNAVKNIDGMTFNTEANTKKLRFKSRKERMSRAKQSNGLGGNCLEKIKHNEDFETKSARIYSLCTHAELRKGPDHLKRMVMAMFLKECLKNNNFFSNEPKNDDDAENAICELLIRNLQLLQFNAHEICETLQGGGKYKHIYVAVGIYATGALFNHECYPAVNRYFDGQKLVLRASRPLALGETVAENYGPHFLTRNLKDRKRSTSCRYWFICNCVACNEDWPLLKDMTPNAVPHLRCPNKGCNFKFKSTSNTASENNCPKCSSVINETYIRKATGIVHRSMELFQDAAQLMNDNKPLEAIDLLCEGIDMYYEVARPPFRELHLAQESLRTCCAMAGNVHIVKTVESPN